MITYVIPTRDRLERLWETLQSIALLPGHEGEVIVIDNASRERPAIPRDLGNGLPVRLLRMEQNIGAAARNWGVQLADERSEWVVMLDDDSHPVGDGVLAAVAEAPRDVAAVMADIFLPEQGCRESGGLPEVFIGCGVAIRRRAFLEAGGYDAAFGYYAEEYDLSAKLLMRGWRVAFDPRFVVHHHKVTAGRDMDLILQRLVRNNGWVLQRYAPETVRRELLREMRGRYRGIAEKEGALAGYGCGLVELRRTVGEQGRRPMARHIFDRFTGLAAARTAIREAMAERHIRTAAVVACGKNEWCVRQALREAGVRVLEDGGAAEAVVIGTMSPGPMMDSGEAMAQQGLRVILPWRPATVQPLAKLAG